MALTKKDWELLELAHRMDAVENQRVEKMIELAETEEAKYLLWVQYMYLYAKEEEMAGVL